MTILRSTATGTDPYPYFKIEVTPYPFRTPYSGFKKNPYRLRTRTMFQKLIRSRTVCVLILDRPVPAPHPYPYSIPVSFPIMQLLSKHYMTVCQNIPPSPSNNQLFDLNIFWGDYETKSRVKGK